MRFLILWCLFLPVLPVFAQSDTSSDLPFQPPIPVEVFVGHRSIFYQHVISKDILNGKYNFFNVSGFDTELNDNQDSYFIISSFISRKIGEGFSVGVGGEIQGPGSFFTAGAQYTYASEDLLLVLFPSITLNGPAEVAQFSLLEYKPELNTKIKGYFRAQFLVTTNFEKLFRSYQQVRIGAEIQHIQFGYAMNIDQFHVTDINKENYGLFVRMLIF